MRPKPEVLFSDREIQARLAAIGAEVAQVFAGKEEICCIGLMKSCMLFMADLIRQIPLDVTCHFLRATTLREESGGGPVRTDIVYAAEIPYEGRDVLLLTDIIDTGITLNFLLDHIRERRPRSLKVCTLIDKPGERKIDVHPDWAVFTIEQPLDRFLVGYGLDFGEFYRGLPYIGTIPRTPPPSEGRKITLSPGS